MLGWDGTQLTLLLRQFQKPMGIALRAQQLAIATQDEVWLFANAPDLAPTYLEDQPGRYDALYLPRALHFTGDLNIHDIAFGNDGLWVVNTRFSCLSTLSTDFSFIPRWRPAFVSDDVPEDRCHLNGLAMVDGQPRYVTALGETDTAGGWRDNKHSGGILIDIEQHEVIWRGLCMPHSPCWHDDRLWVLNSGAGELWQVDPQSGQHHVVCALPGFLRGLCCVGNWAIVGLSQGRERHMVGELPVQQRFSQLLCGVAIIDLTTGDVTGTLEFTTGCQEISTIQFLPQIRRPTILNAEKAAIRQAFTTPEFSYWLRPSGKLSPSSTGA